MKKIVTVLLLVFMQHWAYADTADSQKERCPNAPEFILDNDHFDPDWVPTLVTALGLDRNCVAKLIGVAISGRDSNDRAGLMYQSVLRYYGRGDLKMGFNHNADTRVAAARATFKNPKLSPEYRGSKKDISEFDNDGIPDSKREDISKILCEVLQKSDGNVTYAVGGHLENLEALLKEKHYCDGKALVAQKISQVVIGTGGSMLLHRPETNLGKTMGVRKTAKYVIENLPRNVKLIIGAEGLSGDHYWPKAGDLYKRDKHTDSPMAFIYAVPIYGTFGEHGVGDVETVLYAAYGDTIDGFHMYDQIETCFQFDKELVPYAVKGCKGKNHYYLREYKGFSRMLGKKVIPLMEQNLSQ